MKISELTPRQGNVNVEGTIKEVGEIRIYNKYGRELKVADAIIEDDSGTIKLTLWNDDSEKFRPGDIIRVVNGYVGEYQGEKQLGAGKFGKIERASENITENEPKEIKGEPQEDFEETEEEPLDDY